jgi:hypothetical protein
MGYFGRWLLLTFYPFEAKANHQQTPDGQIFQASIHLLKQVSGFFKDMFASLGDPDSSKFSILCYPFTGLLAATWTRRPASGRGNKGQPYQAARSIRPGLPLPGLALLC